MLNLSLQRKKTCPLLPRLWAPGSPRSVHDVNTITVQVFQVKIKDVVWLGHMETFLWAPVNMVAMPLPSQNVTHSALFLRSPAAVTTAALELTVQLSLSTPTASTARRRGNRGTEPGERQV